ncbi:MAG: histidine kinase [Pseudoclavibacter sp.]
MFAWIDRHHTVLTWTAAGLLTALALLLAWADTSVPRGAPVWAEIAATFICCAVIGVHRTRPGLALALAWVSAGVQMLAGHDAPVFWPTVVAILSVYWAARWGDRRVRHLALVSVGVGTVVAAVFISLFTYPSMLSNRSLANITTTDRIIALVTGGVATLLCLGLAWTAGTLAFTWDRYRAGKTETLVAQRQAASARERTDLARDMHDVLAHSLSVIVSLSDGVRLSTRDLPGPARESLEQISAVGRSALTDVRSLLARLRSDEGTHGGSTPTTIDTLLAQVRATGLDVQLAVTGEAAPITSPTYRTIAHLLREGLTNALRHGDHAQAVRVALDWGAPVRLRVENALPAGVRAVPAGAHHPGAQHATGQGHVAQRSPGQGPGAQHWGILGMAERAALVGGTISSRPHGECWVLDADIPLTSAVDETAGPDEPDRPDGKEPEHDS